MSTNPAKNYEKLGEVNISLLSEIKEKVRLANQAKEAWKNIRIKERIKRLTPLYNLIDKNKKEIALLITKEIGKPIKEAVEDINWDLIYLKWYLENGEKYLNDEITHKEGNVVHKVIYEPIGTVASIVPWNFPFGNFLWGVIPNLIAGNTVVFKHSEECPLTGKLLEKIMDELKLPLGVFSEVYGDSQVGEQLVNQDIDLIWFTGSSKVGKKLYEIAGKKFIKAILELGGSNPAVIFSDVSIDEIKDKLYYKRFLNCGQVCDAVKRLIIHEAIFKKTIDTLKEVIESRKVGDPEDKKTDIGSLVAKRQLELLESQVEDAIKKGAKIITGGKRPGGLKGAYYLPTILTNITKDMRVWKEEVFGPVLAVVSFKTEEEAIRLANDSNYGLGAEVYSKNQERALRVGFAIEAGTININKGNHWLPCNPFGGYKDSGIGREHGKWGLQEFCQIKNIALG
ncbi:MAG: NAD-dependent aldehyde dehydrogenase [Candidatus Roizmanbacteria bacterium GW2011_GWC2_37_13]|uniref:NAD-dependent aldehyde dehydrogenase n=1 Tax=Candidatus Roizmanbacteria bacterium GW2011_GWC2_37_13 TaxID=1618486 RepID=A0A0G0G5W9_9BACT|nr:MAG: NAD-dependent aldehyde dehydrogenase [Candidatus Roizmanbacteria bacterium GW2011_GWC1_37_12]KKQ25452.1 MAG: NAD-dependent aldehyde dehydrogenase [Candidatus Roizmanbacteria bacterium GW2011_GWC2_37_13]